MSNADVFPYGTGRCVLGTEVNTKVKLPPVKATVRPGLGGGRKTPNESTRPSRSSTSLKPADVAPDDVAGRLCFRPNKEN